MYKNIIDKLYFFNNNSIINVTTILKKFISELYLMKNKYESKRDISKLLLPFIAY